MKNIYIISGTTKGIGKSILNQLANDSSNLIFTLNRSIDNTKSENIIHIDCDLSNLDQIKNAFEYISNVITTLEFISITLINNAGVVKPISFISKANTQEIRDAIDINILGIVMTTKLFIEKWQNLQCKKYIINISSGAATKPMAGWSIYTSSKAFMEIFTQSVALEQGYEKYPIKVFGFQPGKVETPMQETVRNSDKADLPTVEIFINSYKNNENFSPDLVSKILLNLLKNEPDSGVIYKAKELKLEFEEQLQKPK